MFVALHELVHHLRYATTHKRTRPRCYPETRPQVSGAERGFHWEEIAFGGIVGVLHHHSKTIFQPSGIVIKTPAPQTRDTKVATGVKRGAEVLSEEDSKVVLHYIGELYLKLGSLLGLLANLRNAQLPPTSKTSSPDSRTSAPTLSPRISLLKGHPTFRTPLTSPTDLLRLWTSFQSMSRTTPREQRVDRRASRTSLWLFRAAL